MLATIDINELQRIIEVTVQKSVHNEFIRLRNDLIPSVTDEEQEDIEKLYGNPNEISKEIAEKITIEI